MKKNLLFFAMLLMATQFFAQTGYGYNNNRIAISADGNSQADPTPWGGTITVLKPAQDAGWTPTMCGVCKYGDSDDWSATPAALAVLAHEGMQGKLVHYSYNNFMASPPNTTETNVMKEGVDDAIQRWEFDASVFYDVTANKTAAINHLADQIKISTAADPLYFIHMGPTEFLYQALEKVKADGDEAAIRHLYIISHSNYNDNHMRREDHRRIEHVLDSFDVTENVNYKRIKDQNSSTNLLNGWSTNNIDGANNYTQWTWMRDHFDPDVNFLWDRMNVSNNSKADISDMGMLWFLLYNDQDGNPSKLKSKFINGVIPGSAPATDGYCPATEIYETDGLLVFEAERIELKGDWKLGTDDEYASGGQYIYYDGPNSYGAQNAANTISYSFKINTPGSYAFKWFIRQGEEERGTVEGQQGSDLSNDVWIKFSDNIGYFGGTQVSEFVKFYGRSGPGFWLHGVAEHDHTHNWMNVKITEAGTYTMEICGRSNGYQIDKIVMAKGISNWGSYTEKTEAQANKYWSETGTPDPDCVRPVKGCATILAKDFTDLDIDGYDPATVEWRKSVTWGGTAKEIIKCDGTNGTSSPIAAEVVYNGEPQGNATFKVHAMQEPDGECTYEVFVNGQKVGEKQISSSYDATHEIEDEGQRNAIEKLIISTQSAIKTGDVIRVTSNQVTNGLVPEGETTATARGRWYALEVCVGEAQIDEYQITSSTVKSLVNTTEADNNNVIMAIKYTATASCDLAYSIKSQDGSEEFAFGRVNGLAAGTHSIDVPLHLETALVLNTEYKIERWFMTLGGNLVTEIKPRPSDISWTFGASTGPPTVVFNGMEPNAGGYIKGGSAAAGSSIEITGTGYNAGDLVTGSLTNWTGWSNGGATVYGTYEVTADAIGNISGTLVIDAATPVGAAIDGTSGTGYMIQVRGTSEGSAITFKHGKTFANIELEVTASTSINSLKAYHGSVYVSGNTLFIKDVTANNFEIFNLGGSVVKSGSIDGSLMQIPLSLSKGIYIVKVGNEATKIAF